MRALGDTRAWLADGVLDVHHDAPDWSDRILFDVPGAAVYAIAVQHVDGDAFELRRGTGANPQLELYAPLPMGSTARQSEMKYLSGIFERLTFSNAKPLSEIENIVVLQKVSVTAVNGLIFTLNRLSGDEDAGVWANLDVTSVPGISLPEAAKHELERVRNTVTGWVFLLPRPVSERLKIRLKNFL